MCGARALVLSALLLLFAVPAVAAADEPSIRIAVLQVDEGLEYRKPFSLQVEITNVGALDLPRGVDTQLLLSWATFDRFTGNLIRFKVIPVGDAGRLAAGARTRVCFRAVVGPWERDALQLSVGESASVAPIPSTVAPIGAPFVQPLRLEHPELTGEPLRIRQLATGLVSTIRLLLGAAVLAGAAQALLALLRTRKRRRGMPREAAGLPPAGGGT